MPLLSIGRPNWYGPDGKFKFGYSEQAVKRERKAFMRRPFIHYVMVSPFGILVRWISITTQPNGCKGMLGCT